MAALASLLYRLGFVGGWSRSRRQTESRVKAYLTQCQYGHEAPVSSIPDRDAERIRRALETVPTLVSDPRVQRRFQGFDRYLEVLPRILVEYMRGRKPSQIADDLHFLATGFGVETVLDITSQIVAERLASAPSA